jgi:prephenate dehydrogenase
MKVVAIAGVGLIGASFGLALRRAGFTGEILGVSSERSIEAARRVGAIDYGITIEDAARRADLIFLSRPIFGIIETLAHLGPIARKGTLITDAGSTKVTIETAARESLQHATFVGGHPMAGKEARGAEAADAALFEGRPWIFTSEPAHPVFPEFREWIRRIGAREKLLDAATHDRMVAWASHLPQLASTALAAVLAHENPEAAAVAGPGLIDMTRLAMSSWDLWSDILGTNGPEVSAALDAYIAKLESLRSELDRNFEDGAKFARALRNRE